MDIAVTFKNAVEFVKSHAVVLESGRGPVLNLAEAVAGKSIQGNWWGHPQGREIFAATREVRNSADVIVCRLIDGKVTYLHRQVWPAIVRLAEKFGTARLTAIREEHRPTGKHQVVETPFPDWVPPEVQAAARRLSEEEAVRRLGEPLAVILLGRTGPQSRKNKR